MNIFLLSPNVTESCRELSYLDPGRARCQLKECCQLLACVDHLQLGGTNMIKANGERYRKAHPHHPITKNMTVSCRNYSLCMQVAQELALIYPSHACSKSLYDWMRGPRATVCMDVGPSAYCVCRKDQEHVYVTTTTEYSDLIRPYVMAKINYSQGEPHEVH